MTQVGTKIPDPVSMDSSMGVAVPSPTAKNPGRDVVQSPSTGVLGTGTKVPSTTSMDMSTSVEDPSLSVERRKILFFAIGTHN